MNTVTENYIVPQQDDETLLESVLFLMTPQQRKHFLESSLTDGVFYANKSPGFGYPLSVVLSRTARENIIELHNHKNTNDELSINIPDESVCIRALKDDLDAGIRFSGAPIGWHTNNTGSNDLPLYVQSRLFSMKCKLKEREDGSAFLLATYIESSNDNKKNKMRDLNENFEFCDIPELEEPIDIDVCDADAAIKDVTGEEPDKIFYPHVTTTWNVYPQGSTDVEYFDAKAIKELVWQIVSNRLSAGAYLSARQHLKELADAVNLSRLAMQYRYTIEEMMEDSDGINSCILKVYGPQDDVAKMKFAYVFAEDGDTIDDYEGKYKNAFHLLRRRLRRPAVLERKGAKREFHIFDILNGQNIPLEGFLVDIGFESQIKKQIEAIQSLAASQTIVHLIKLTTLIGDVKTSKLEPFSWKDDGRELFDKQLTLRQREAVIKALNTLDMCLIQGPPGTGKTRVISEIVQQASAMGLKTLLVAPTHIAVDNVLENVGSQDNISAIRCVNKDRLDSLAEHIQRFTYEKRKQFLVVQSQDKVKKDIERMQKERKRLQDALDIIEAVYSIKDEKKRLVLKVKKLTERISSTPLEIERKFDEQIRNRTAIFKEKEQEFKDSENELNEAVKTLDSLKAKIKKFKSGIYTGNVKTQFDKAKDGVENIEGKALDNAKTQLNDSQERISSIIKDIEQAAYNLKDASDILHQMDQGITPYNVSNAIEQAIMPISAQYDKIINGKHKELETARIKSAENEEDIFNLECLIEKTTRKLCELNNNRSKPLWYKMFSSVWWESKVTDFQSVCSQNKEQLQNCLSLKSSMEGQMKNSQAMLEKAKADKEDAVKQTRLIEFKKQYELYRSMSEKLILEQHSLHNQLQQKRSVTEILIGKVESAQQDFDQALTLASESAKRHIRKDLSSNVKADRKNIRLCREKAESAKRQFIGSQTEVEILTQKIKEAIEEKQRRLSLEVEAIKADIAAANDKVESLSGRFVALAKEELPQKPSEKKKTIEKFTQQMAANEDLSAFSKQWLDCLNRNSEQLSMQLAKYVNLVCATTVGIASDEYFGDGNLLEQKQFDMLVIDEAGKVTEAEFLVAATRAKKWVIVGDHKQLPPYYDRKLDEIFSAVNTIRKKNKLPPIDQDILKISYFENLWNQLSAENVENPEKTDSRLVTLNIQRRMHPKLAMFISDMFYKNEYHSPDDPEFLQEKTLDLQRFQYPVTFIEVSPKRRGRLETNLAVESDRQQLRLLCKTGYANQTEAQKTVEVLQSLLDEESIFVEQQELDCRSDSAAVIGIMAFYAGQVELIRRLIQENSFLDAQECSGSGQYLCKGKINVIVNTVDSFQGKECSVIILSFTRSNPRCNIGFVDDANRLNVAMSRARKKLILLGDTATFINRASARDNEVEGEDSNSICKERLFFTKLVEYIEGHGEVKKAFHVWRTPDDTV